MPDTDKNILGFNTIPMFILAIAGIAMLAVVQYVNYFNAGSLP